MMDPNPTPPKIVPEICCPLCTRYPPTSKQTRASTKAYAWPLAASRKPRRISSADISMPFSWAPKDFSAMATMRSDAPGRTSSYARKSSGAGKGPLCLLTITASNFGLSRISGWRSIWAVTRSFRSSSGKASCALDVRLSFSDSPDSFESGRLLPTFEPIHGSLQVTPYVVPRTSNHLRCLRRRIGSDLCFNAAMRLGREYRSETAPEGPLAFNLHVEHSTYLHVIESIARY